jgi:hypothetical protein
MYSDLKDGDNPKCPPMIDWKNKIIIIATDYGCNCVKLKKADTEILYWDNYIHVCRQS